MTISRQFFETAMRNPNKVAVIQDDVQLTYAGLLARVQHQAYILRRNDVKRHDHVMVRITGIDFVVMLLAAADTGVCLVPLGKDAMRETIGKAYHACDCKFLINEGAFFSEQPYANSMRLKFEGQPDDNLLIITTSGSTGDPKPILLKQRTKLARVEMMNDLYHCTADDVTLVSTPLHHSMGQRLALMSVLKGGTLVLMDGWSAEKWWDLVEEREVTFAVPVASQVKQIVNRRLVCMAVDERTQSVDKMNSLRCIVSSSAPLDADLMRAMPCPVHNCYGTTEVSIATSTDSTTPLGSVGKPISDVLDIEIRDDGEIRIDTTLLFDGYYNRPDLTDEAMWSGYFKTGDLGKMDAEGNLYYLGRTKELINVGGTKVYPQDVEAVFAGHDSILECAAFPQIDDDLGEIVALAIVLKDASLATAFDWEREVQKMCLPLLTDAQLPRAVYVFVDQLPKTETGKLQRGKLAAIVGADK